MPRLFVPGSIDYDGPMSRDFNCGRGLSSHSLAVWRAALEPHIGQADIVLDLGSGTGRFATLSARWFNTLVIGVEPATGMRLRRARIRHTLLPVLFQPVTRRDLIHVTVLVELAD
jgi:hypothetical protein